MTTPYESSHPTLPVPTPWQLRGLWACIVGAPLVALGDLQAGYTLALMACARGLRWLPVVSTCLALALAAVAIAYARRVGGEEVSRPRIANPEAAPLATHAWVALVAIVLHLMAVLVVLAMAIPRVTLDPCWR